LHGGEQRLVDVCPTTAPQLIGGNSSPRFATLPLPRSSDSSGRSFTGKDDVETIPADAEF